CRLVIDPLREALDEADHVIFALDDALHLVPLDALPADEPPSASGPVARLGDRLRIETRVTLTELSAPPHPADAPGALVVRGGVNYGEASTTRVTGLLRGGAWSGGFPELPETAVEATSIAAAFAAEQPSGRVVTPLGGEHATRELLFEAAPRARWLHI